MSQLMGLDFSTQMWLNKGRMGECLMDKCAICGKPAKGIACCVEHLKEWSARYGHKKGKHYRKCPVCGIGFIPRDTHGWGTNRFCSYSCYIKDDSTQAARGYALLAEWLK